MAHSARYRYLSDLISYSHIRCTGARERVIWSGYINHHMDNMINQKLKYLVRNRVRYKQICGVKVSPIKHLKHECVKLINQHASFMYEAIKILVCENKIDTVEIDKLKNRVITPGFKMISKVSLEPY